MACLCQVMVQKRKHDDVEFGNTAALAQANRLARRPYPEEGSLIVTFPWSTKVRYSAMEGSFVCLIGDIPLNTLPQSTTPHQHPTNNPNYMNTPPMSFRYPYPCPRHDLGPKARSRAYASGINMSLRWILFATGGALGYRGCWRGIGGSFGTSMVH